MCTFQEVVLSNASHGIQPHINILTCPPLHNANHENSWTEPNERQVASFVICDLYNCTIQPPPWVNMIVIWLVGIWNRQHDVDQIMKLLCSIFVPYHLAKSTWQVEYPTGAYPTDAETTAVAKVQTSAVRVRNHMDDNGWSQDASNLGCIIV